MSERKDVNVKASMMIKRINEAKKMAKHILFDCKCMFNSKTCKSNQKWNNDKRSVKEAVFAKRIKVAIVAHVFGRKVGI